MASLYYVRFAGETGRGDGAMYVGNGVVAGFDTAGGRYMGTYIEQWGRFRATVSFSMPGGGEMVTGLQVSSGTSIPLSVDWPANFANGHQEIIIQGKPVTMTLEKMNDFDAIAPLGDAGLFRL